MTAPLHLSEQQLQGLADGTLRGPEGFAAREHCDTCAACAAETEEFAALVKELDSLVDPLVPADFTASVLQAVSVRETALLQRRHTWYAAVPALAVAAFAMVGWALSVAPTVHVDRLIGTWTTMRHVAAAAGPVLQTLRLPLGIGAFLFAVAVLFVLLRTIRTNVSGPTPASS
jgi:anti-sigma factor RsiW